MYNVVYYVNLVYAIATIHRKQTHVDKYAI